MIHTVSNDTTLPSHSCPRQGMFCLFSVVVALVHRETYIISMHVYLLHSCNKALFKFIRMRHSPAG